MHRNFVTECLLMLLLVAVCPAVPPATAPNSMRSSSSGVVTLADKPLSERIVAYEIDARFDATKHTVDATEILTYRNLTGRPQDTFPFHLYLNAFNPSSTFMKEERLNRSEFEWKD